MSNDQSAATQHKVVAFIAAGEHEAIAGTKEFHLESEAEARAMVANPAALSVESTTWGSNSHVVAAEYLTRTDDGPWSVVATSRTADKLDWSRDPEHGQPTP